MVFSCIGGTRPSRLDTIDTYLSKDKSTGMCNHKFEKMPPITTSEELESLVPEI